MMDKFADNHRKTKPFSPQDRIGQLTMRNLNITDTRAKLRGCIPMPGCWNWVKVTTS
jgi:hypothetical protein